MSVLNRKERRKMLKRGQLESVVAETITETYQKIKLDTIGDMTLITLMTLHDKFGFGTKRLNNFHQSMGELCDCLKAGTLSLDDIKEYLVNECKLEL